MCFADARSAPECAANGQNVYIYICIYKYIFIHVYICRCIYLYPVCSQELGDGCARRTSTGNKRDCHIMVAVGLSCFAIIPLPFFVTCTVAAWKFPIVL